MAVIEIGIGNGDRAAGESTTIVGGDRFRLWTGRSGRRRVFSRLDGAATAEDLDGAVAMIVTAESTPRLLWIGVGEELPRARRVAGTAVFVHWLAETEAERARVIEDLGGPARRGPAVVTGPALAA